MSNKPWIARALSLALCTAALSACQNSAGNSSNQVQAGSTSGDVGPLDNSSARQIREVIAQAPANGLRPDLFLKSDTKDGAALTDAALHYANALANGYADPGKLHEVYTIPHRNVDVRQGLKDALQKGDIKNWFQSLTPQTDEYRALSQAYVHYLELGSPDAFQQVPDGKPITPGSHDPRVPAVAAALRAVGYLGDAQQQQTVNATQSAKPQQPAAAPSTAYSPALVAAVRKLQGEWGFTTDGVIGGDTLDALNAGPRYRARQLAIAMERLRWLPRDPPQTRVDVNTASATLDFWRDGQHIDRRKVVVGEPDKPTPQLQAPIYRLVANPTWTVPKGIAANELAKKGSAYLSENNFVMKDGYYVQQSGPKNSLGLVKFDMQDDEAIYLHDTPAKALFGMPDRHRSHGCVRVENALQFATDIAQQQGILDEFKKAMATNEETFVKLKNPIPVRLLYHTAYWDGSNIQFRSDIYGWDDNVAKALGLQPGPPHKLSQPESSDDIGP